MKEEFHGNGGDGIPTTQWKVLYGWGTINASVWLPSLSELVGTTGVANSNSGCYLSAMQGLNTSGQYWIDTQGGEQFAYFKQSNASGGGSRIWDICRQSYTWLRSPSCGHTTYTWQVTNDQQFDWVLPTYSLAVHPARVYKRKKAAIESAAIRMAVCLSVSGCRIRSSFH